MKVALCIFGYERPSWRRVIVLFAALFAALGIQLAISLVLAEAIDDEIRVIWAGHAVAVQRERR